MRSYHVNQGRRRDPKAGKWIWPLLVIALLGINIYLFGFRGLPGREAAVAFEEAPALEEPQSPATAEEPTPSASVFSSNLGDMRGVAGIREMSAKAGARQAMRQALQNSSTRARFNLDSAAGIAGQRDLEQWCRKESGQIGVGQTFSTALNVHDMQPGQVNEIIAALNGVMNFHHCRVGESYELLISPKGEAQRFTYRKSPLLTYEAQRVQGKLIGQQVDLDAQVEIADIGVRIGQGESLYLSLDRAGENPALVMMIVDIFAWDIDFYVDTHPGDTIRLVVEKMTLDGQFVRYGEILAAEYSGIVGRHQAFRHTIREGSARQENGYFDEKGGSLRKAFLKTPLKFARISSGFGRRVHPVLGFNKMHNGVDFAAPIGTPIWAPADGTVVFAGRKGVSGNLIILRHANGYQTVFAHLHQIGRGVRSGVRVRQKQVIGTVGNTGRSTGPHLHYGMMLRGRHVNPLRQKFPPAEPVPGDELPAYLKAIAGMRERLQTIEPPETTHTASADSTSRDAG